MFSVIVLNLLIFPNCWTAGTDQLRLQGCLPQNVKLSEVVSVERGPNGKAVRKRTVEDRLNELKARCRKGKLIDKRGKPIQRLEQQRIELRKLRKRFTVVEMSCDVSDSLIP
jgi:hypothetical protein